MRVSEHISINLKGFRWLWQKERRAVLLIVGCSLLGATKSYIPLYFSAKIIDSLVLRAPVNTLVRYVLLTVGLAFLFDAVLRFLEPRKGAAFNRIFQNERWSYGEKAMQMAYASIEDTEVSVLRERIRMESQTGYNLFYLLHTVDTTIYTVAQIICSLMMTLPFFAAPAVQLWHKLLFVGMLLISVAVESICEVRFTRVSNEFMDECVMENIRFEKYGTYIADYGTGKDIRLYGIAESLLRDWEKGSAVLHEKAKKRSRGWLKADTPRLIMDDAVKFAANAVLIAAAISGAVSVGSISKYVSAVVKLLWAVTYLSRTVMLAAANSQYLKRYFSYFDIPNNMYKGSLTVEKRDDTEYYVEFRDVSFRYPGSESYALRHINFKFKIGEKLAIVGKNGSGKTTFIKLLCRLYDPTEGEILLNGVNIQKYDYDEYMSIFSIVFQDFSLFAFSLGQNVAAAKSYDPQRAERCLQMAGLGERLRSLPQGLDTCLHKHYDKEGVEISGGEAQKIALARALYKDAPFIILDEPTAALDPVAEYEVYSGFDALAGEKTAVYISHRLASCRFCDTVAVFDMGEIVQSGTHRELLADTGGVYHALWHAQAQYYTEKNG
ncbi:MAG: ABC transporter ATP-binding protein [Oscillospiraceae bacterium]|nr:ABC transporter ATP-binding protein [Oscillospiraceae bacterium]